MRAAIYVYGGPAHIQLKPTVIFVPSIIVIMLSNYKKKTIVYKTCGVCENTIINIYIQNNKHIYVNI